MGRDSLATDSPTLAKPVAMAMIAFEVTVPESQTEKFALLLLIQEPLWLIPVSPLKSIPS
jgi:hypothetical protein